MVHVLINGREVIACNVDEHPDLKDRLKSGYIGLQNHRSPISFRNVRIKNRFRLCMWRGRGQTRGRFVRDQRDCEPRRSRRQAMA